MSVIDIQLVKAALHVIHEHDDLVLQQHLDGAEDEAVRFMNRDELPTLPQDFPSSENYSEDVPTNVDPVAPSVVDGVILLVKAAYEATTPEEVAGYRRAAETKFQPYRVGLGV